MNGAQMHALATDLYPICRSITGDGLRETLRRLQQHVPLEIREVKSGTQVLDWTVPKEWNIRDAYVADAAGKRVIDFRQSSLHVLNYSTPIREKMPLAELKPHLFTLPDHPDWVPYRTSYYAEAWGFCAAHRVVEALPAGDYEVVIDSTLAPGSLSYGELVIPGETRDEVLLSCHSCHPSLANDNLSGIAVAVALAQQLAAQPRRRFTYRFLFIPGTIGSITWLAGHEDVVPRIQHGLVLSCVGDAGGFTYKRSRRGDAPVDRAVAHVLRHTGTPHAITDFVPYGYDERQYCSPGFNLAVGCFMRTPNGRYPEYHTSADNLSLVKPEALEGSLAAVRTVLAVLEGDGRFRNLSPKGEPQLGRRGLYGATGGAAHLPGFEFALLWVLNFSDGSHSLLDIAERAGMPFAQIRAAADALLAQGLLAAA
ncbi:MAG TPA: DUF4910 domain-containing protein [Gemmatimonadales bacterium]|nr:DUF4910 domain-containing protein [Gemmatimonadales bacterium]